MVPYHNGNLIWGDSLGMREAHYTCQLENPLRNEMGLVVIHLPASQFHLTELLYHSTFKYPNIVKGVYLEYEHIDDGQHIQQEMHTIK